MPSLTANDIKTQGVAAIEAQLEKQTEVVISVRGQDRFVVMDIARYHFLRECELDAALTESAANMAAGRYVPEAVPQHMARLEAMLPAEDVSVASAATQIAKPATKLVRAKRAVKTFKKASSASSGTP